MSKGMANECQDMHKSSSSEFESMEEIVPNGVFKKILITGRGKTICEDDAILWNMTAFILGDDEPLELSHTQGKPALFRVREGSFIEGLFRGLLTMRKGEKCELVVMPQYAFINEMILPPRVSPNNTIRFMIQIIEVFEECSIGFYNTMSQEEREKLSFDDILKMCDGERLCGNTFFHEKKYGRSIKCYRRIIQCLIHFVPVATRNEKKQIDQLLLHIYCNLINCCNKLGEYGDASFYSRKALRIDPNCVKALYQCGIANMGTGNREAAMHHLRRANDLMPRNENIKNALKKLEQKRISDNMEEQIYIMCKQLQNI